MTWYDDAGHGDAKSHALRTGDYVDPRDEMPTLAECQRDEAEAFTVVPMRPMTAAEEAVEGEWSES